MPAHPISNLGYKEPVSGTLPVRRNTEAVDRSDCSTVVAGNQAVAGSLAVVDILTPLDKAGNRDWRDMPPADIPDWQAGADNQSEEVEC